MRAELIAANLNWNVFIFVRAITVFFCGAVAKLNSSVNNQHPQVSEWTQVNHLVASKCSNFQKGVRVRREPDDKTKHNVNKTSKDYLVCEHFRLSHHQQWWIFINADNSSYDPLLYIIKGLSLSLFLLQDPIAAKIITQKPEMLEP